MCDMLLDASEWYELGLRFVERLSHLFERKTRCDVSPFLSPPQGDVSSYRIAICEKLWESGEIS